MPLRQKNTNAGDDSDGKFWGIEYDNLIGLLFGLFFSIATVMVVYKNTKNFAQAALLGPIPFFICMAYIFGLRQGKPPGFDTDLLETIIYGKGWMNKPSTKTHPLKEKLK